MRWVSAASEAMSSKLGPTEGGAPPLDVCFLIRPQPPSKTPKIPKIYTKTGDKGRVGQVKNAETYRFHFKVLQILCSH